MTSIVYGVSPATSVAVSAYNGTGNNISYAVGYYPASAPSGQSFSMSDSGYAPANSNLVIYQYVKVEAPGAYATSIVAANW